jgi:hypothetical protein
MFGLFKSKPFSDPQLGEFLRSRGYWRGSITFGELRIPLLVSGDRNEPDSQAMQEAHGLSSRFPAWKRAIENALFEHYTPYAEALAAGELPPPSEPIPKLEAPGQVWPHVTLAFVSVSPLDSKLTTEFGYTAAWDEEHTLGARFQAGRFVELCGSVVPA